MHETSAAHYGSRSDWFLDTCRYIFWTTLDWILSHRNDKGADSTLKWLTVTILLNDSLFCTRHSFNVASRFGKTGRVFSAANEWRDQSVFEDRNACIILHRYGTVREDENLRCNIWLFQLLCEHLCYFFNNANLPTFCRNCVCLSGWISNKLVCAKSSVDASCPLAMGSWGQGDEWGVYLFGLRADQQRWRRKEESAKKKMWTTITYITYTPIVQLTLFMLLLTYNTCTDTWQQYW